MRFERCSPVALGRSRDRITMCCYQIKEEDSVQQRIHILKVRHDELLVSASMTKRVCIHILTMALLRK